MRLLRIIGLMALLAAILLAPGAPAAAQSGGGYDLTWNTLDAGGAMGAAGGSYGLNGTIGQPDAGYMTGGSYVLRSGFWHPCNPQSVAVTIACSSGHVELSWTANAANVGYDIYRDTTPYFTPGPASRQASVAGGPWTDPTAATCGDTATNYTYIVRSICMGWHTDGGRIGEFDFSLVKGE